MTCNIFYKSDRTGNAWWPWSPGKGVTFENNQIYKIFGRVYTANTGAFREAWDDAQRDATWNTMKNKGPET